MGKSAIWQDLSNQIFLGSASFVMSMQQSVDSRSGNLSEIPRSQRRSIAKPLEFYVNTYCDNKAEGMRQAYNTGDFTMPEIARSFGVHYSTVSRAFKIK